MMASLRLSAIVDGVQPAYSRLAQRGPAYDSYTLLE
jgi:hypothetical protein